MISEHTFFCGLFDKIPYSSYYLSILFVVRLELYIENKKTNRQVKKYVYSKSLIYKIFL